jgi:Family of unknown function (DUF5906)
VDFFQIRERETKKGIDIYPEFVVRPTQDLMVRGGSFYAVWDEEAGLWSTDEYDVQRLVDKELAAHAEKQEGLVHVKTLRNYGSGVWKDWRSYLGNLADSYRQLDCRIAFANTPPRKEDYTSKRLPYSIEAGSISAFDALMGTLYDPEERQKLEWIIGAIASGDSTSIDKFIVLYGETGTGKSTYLNIVQKLFEIYTSTFDAAALTGLNNTFGTGAFRTNPLVAIQHDADLSKIERNETINSIVSHESIIINQKYLTPYSTVLSAILLIGTNKSVKITDAKSGIIRRLIDVHPSGRLLPVNEYEAAVSQVDFELGAIAAHCLAVYRTCGKHYYYRYKPMDMITRTDIFYNFVMSSYDMFKEHDGTTLKQAWNLYKIFCDEGGYEWRLQMHKFRDELRNYFTHFTERGRVEGVSVSNLYTGFRTERLSIVEPVLETPPSLVMDSTESLLDEMLAGNPAQYAKDDGTPKQTWARAKTTLSTIDTSKLHYVKLDSQHIVIDFDLRGADGEKDLSRNLEAASLFPPTYAELSKSGAGIHLHYIYNGDVSELSSQYSPGVEVKIYLGDASLRRQLSKCNHIPVATIKSGLPLKERRVIDTDKMTSEKGLRELIMRNLRKEIHPGTRPSVSFITKILDDAYDDPDMHYDVTDLRPRILAFANNSSHHSLECIKMVQQMKFSSDPDKKSAEVKSAENRLVHYDVEVYPNLFVLCWKFDGEANVVRMINPSPAAVEEVAKMKLVGFNNRRYDNHILYARIMGYSNMDLFKLSQRIIANERSGMFGDAYDLSYADVWEMSSKRQSLKKFQIELGLNHKEIGFAWDEPIPEDRWEEVVDYCVNDVITQEQVFHARKQDYVARQILATLSGLKVNDTTQRHTARIIFGDAKKPSEEFLYTHLEETFPGYHYDMGHSWFMGEEVGEGGYVYAEPGMYSDVAVLDVASMHPTSIIMLDLFGSYTERFSALTRARIAIKRKDYKGAKRILPELEQFLDSDGDAAALADALKLAINIVYGLTSASFDNPFRDKRNKDNIVAKRGALFMVALKKAVQDKGFQVVHIKTDSIKIPGATDEIIEFVKQFGSEYGYDFEHEVTYDKFCLVNDAVYVARGSDGAWSATGAQFAHPFVFKTLFSYDPLQFGDFCETKSVTKGALYLQFSEDEDPHFVGRAGLFVPVLEGHGGGVLLRIDGDKRHSASGAKGFLWKEAAVVQELGQDDAIDFKYFQKLADAALKNISQYGDVDWFRE